MVEQGTRIVEMKFGSPVPNDLLDPNMTPRQLEVVRACFDGTEVPISDGSHTLPEVDEDFAELTKVRTELLVEAGRGIVRSVHPNSVPNAGQLYGRPETRLERPGQAYYMHQMKNGEVRSLVACRVAPSEH